MIGLQELVERVETTKKIVRCQCEQSMCDHGEHACFNEAIVAIKTIYGTFLMCLDCGERLPERFIAR